MRVAAGILSCLLAACVSSTPAPSPTLSNRAMCARLVDDFFAAWNDDAGRVVGLFTVQLEFHDSVGGRARDLASRDDLQRYLTERFALDDRFSGLTISIPENPAPAAANPTVSFVRTIGATTYRGNAKLVCAGNVLTGLVMSAE